MKQESEYYEHFYRQLEPNKHYMPLKHDLSDVPEKVRWAKENDEKARKTGFSIASIVFERFLGGSKVGSVPGVDKPSIGLKRLNFV